MAGVPRGERAALRMAVVAFCVLVSLLLHGGVLAAVLFWVETKPGAIALPTEAISIELVPSDVLEAVQERPTPEASASSSSVESNPGAAESVPAAAPPAEPPERAESVERAEQVAANDLPKTDTKEHAPPVEETPPGPQQEAEAATDEASKPMAAVTKAETPSHDPTPPARTVKTAKLVDAVEPRKTKSRPTNKGGARSRAAKGSASSSARVSASAGSAINYAAVVRAHVTARKPTGTGRPGTVVITFGVSRSGGLSYAGILRPSGDTGLDRSVLSAVRGAAPFPPPPPGASPGQLRFQIPFYFQ